jgi:hypothetical protein
MSMQVLSFVLHAGDSISDPADCGGNDVVRITMPDAWTGDWDTPLTFLLSDDGVNFHNLYHVVPNAMVNFEVQVPQVHPGATVTFPSGMGLNLNWVKVRSGTAAVPVVQEEDRAFQLELSVADTTSAGAA